jgi:site-specific DNA recombinase
MSLTTPSSLDELYENGANKIKREIIGSIFPAKLVFEGFNYQTTRLNKAVAFICSLDKGFSQNKNGQTESIFDLSTSVRQRRFELPHPFGRYHLKVVRLPISPSPQVNSVFSKLRIQ